MNSDRCKQIVNRRCPRAVKRPRSLSIGRAVLVLTTLACLIGFVATARAEYGYKKSITILPGQVVSGPQSSFPMLFSVTDPSLMTTAWGGRVTNYFGYDIVFKASDNTTLAHEIEKYDRLTGEYVAWVNVPSINNGTVIYMHYGDSSITYSTENKSALWGNAGASPNFRSVYHLKEDPATSATIFDSTINGYNLNSIGRGTQQPGKIDGSCSFASEIYKWLAQSLAYNDISFSNTTFSAWVKTNLNDSIRVLLGKSLPGGGGYQMAMTATGNFQFGHTLSNGTLNLITAPSSAPILNDDNWHYVVASVNRSTSGPINLYVDGNLVATDYSNTSSTWSNGGNFSIGISAAIGAVRKSWMAGFDEVRVAATTRSDGWVATEYKNQNSPNTFYALGSEEAVTAGTSYTISASCGANGSISPSGAVSVASGGSQSFTISPTSGYMVLDVQVDGASVGAPSSYTFSNVTINHTIQASFAPIGYAITTNASHGSIMPPGPVSVPSGGSQSFTIQPDSGYTLDRVLVDGASIGKVSSYTFTNVQAAHTIEAQFVPVAAPPDPSTCLEIADIPLEVRRLSAPANIMFVLDDSGSMDWEMLIPGFYNGAYQDSSYYTYGYVFDNPCSYGVYGLGCHQTDGSWPSLPRGSGRLVWKTQWFDYNKTYYNPTMTYEPWVTMTGQFDNANPDNPRSHPLADTITFNLSASYDTTSITSGEVIADNANPAVFSKTGSWTAASDVQAYNNTYYHTSQNNSDVTATWSPYLLGGQYQVFTRYRATDERDTKVPYTVTHANGTSIVQVNQRLLGGEWVPLGSYYFATGTANVKIAFHVNDNDHNRVCADAVKFVPIGSIPVDIKNAHYYVWSAQTGAPYLVIIDGGVVSYYQVNDINANGMVDPGELVQTASPPSDVVTARTYAQERQNFANWFTFYRRRIFAAQNAVGKLIKSMQGVRIGIYSINRNLVQPTLPVKVEDQDEGATLLSLLYAVNALGGTPLQTGLEAVGRYFDKADNIKLDGTAGDDSPWYSEANGGSCQQAFTIMITDGYYNGGLPTISEPNADGGQGFPYADSYSNTLADIAMYYYKRDLNTTLPDNSPTNPYDAAAHQHMVTYSIGFGVSGTLNPADYDETFKHKVSRAPIVWPDPLSSDAAHIDDFWHAAVNGRGKFLSATNPAELTQSLQEVMQNVELRLKSSAQVSVSGDKLYQKLTPDLLMFQNTYSSDGWTGDIKAYTVNPVTGAVSTNTPAWSAAEKLQGRTWDSRRIATYSGSAGIPFRYDSLTATQKSQLNVNPTTADNLVKYLRGDASKEVQNGGTFRNRFSRLGDIVHSAPVFSSGILYAGSNDGLLHAFKADSGDELFAYAPNLIFDRLKDLAGTSYAHRYYVDLTPTVTDLKFDGGIIKTYLVGGLGKGGRGYFALDVTGMTQTNVPSTETSLAQKVMWEYPRTGTSSSEIADLGYSFSRPNIVRSNATASAAAAGIVIFGNGYDSSNGHAVLYILRADTGELLKRIDTGVATCNGLSPTITVDVNYDNKVDYVYAGDLNGNLWKFDLTSTDYNSWDVAYSSTGAPKPLFKTPLGQPITTKPNVMYHCSKHGYMVTFGTGRYLGEADLSDASQQAVYGIWDYGDDVDDSESVGTLTAAGALSSTNLPITVSLLQQTLDRAVTVNGMNMRIMAANAADWKTTSSTTVGGACGDNSGPYSCDPNNLGSKPNPLKHAGWYFNLPSARERVVSDVIVRSGVLTVVSHAPSNSLCGGSGESWLMTLDACSGSRLSKTQFDINGDGKIDTNDLVNIGTTLNPIWVAPSGIKYDGKVQPPTYLILPNGTELLYMSSSKVKIETQVERAAKLGITYWRVMH